MSTIVDDETRRTASVRHFGFIGQANDAGSHDLYHDDAVLEFPQSGERFEGVDNFREWRRAVPRGGGIPLSAGSLGRATCGSARFRSATTADR